MAPTTLVGGLSWLAAILFLGSSCTSTSQLATLTYTYQKRSMDCTTSMQDGSSEAFLKKVELLDSKEQRESWAPYFSANSISNVEAEDFSVQVQTVRWGNGDSEDEVAVMSRSSRMVETKKGIQALLADGVITESQAKNLVAALESKMLAESGTESSMALATWASNPYQVNNAIDLTVLELTFENDGTAPLQAYKDSLHVLRGSRAMHVYRIEELQRLQSGDAFKERLLLDADMGPSLMLPPGKTITTWVGVSPMPLGTHELEVYYGAQLTSTMTCRSETDKSVRSERYFVESSSWDYRYDDQWIIFATENAGEVWYNKGVLYLNESIFEEEPIIAVYYHPDTGTFWHEVFTYKWGTIRTKNYKAISGLQRLTNKIRL